LDVLAWQVLQLAVRRITLKMPKLGEVFFHEKKLCSGALAVGQFYSLNKNDRANASRSKPIHPHHWSKRAR
jgi:hypothetical protein